MNEKELRIKMLEKDVNARELCNVTGMCQSAFTRKMQGKSEFKQSEIGAIKKRLCLSDSEVTRIFFAT